MITNILNIVDNPNFNRCSIKPICRALIDGNLAILTISNNGVGDTCNDADKITADCQAKETYIDYTICPGDTILLNAVSYTSAGIYYQDLTNLQGLDSILVIDITVSLDCLDDEIDPNLCPQSDQTRSSNQYQSK